MNKKIFIKVSQIAVVLIYSILYLFLFFILSNDNSNNWVYWLTGFYAVTYPLGVLFCRKTKTNPMLMALAVVPLVIRIIAEMVQVAVTDMQFNDFMLANSPSHHLLVVFVICAIRAILLLLDFCIVKKIQVISMKNKKKAIIISVATIILVAGLVAIAILCPYRSDRHDTEDNYLCNIDLVNYENTVETAIPQTELYNVLTNHFNSDLAPGTTEKKAIIIGYDGCRADALNLVEKENSGITKMLDDGASLNLSYCGGVNYPQTNTQATSTGPGWCAVLTGQWGDVTGITANSITKSMEYKTFLTEFTENGTLNGASFITRWKGHFVNDDSTYKLEKEYCEEQGLNVDYNYCKNNEKCELAVISEIEKADCNDFLFVVYEGTDSAGHNTGFSINNPIYRNGFEECESMAYNTISAIENRETYATEDWLIIITSDHGGYGTGHGGPTIQERMTFIVCNK